MTNHRDGTKAEHDANLRRVALEFAFESIDAWTRIGGIPMMAFPPWLKAEIRKRAEGPNPRFTVTESLLPRVEYVRPRRDRS